MGEMKKVLQFRLTAEIGLLRLNVNIPCTVSVSWKKGIQYGETTDT